MLAVTATVQSYMVAFEFWEASLGVVAQACNLTPGSLKQEGLICDSSWGYVEKKANLIKSKYCQAPRQMFVIQQSGRQMQGDPCELEASLLYRVSPSLSGIGNRESLS